MLVTERQLPVSAVGGFTIIQLIASMAILGILAAFAVPGYQIFIERARNARTIAQISEIEIAISKFSAANAGQLPADLAAIGLSGAQDPWGNSIVYVNLALGGSPRVDQDGSAVNVTYDLYSTGADGATSLSLAADSSADDIVRASDGGFAGVVSDYSRLK